MNGTADNYNLPNNVIDIIFPCSKYIGKAIQEHQTTTNKSPRCNKCHYTEVEHKYGYPLFPLHPVKLNMGVYANSMGKLAGKPLYGKSQYSEFWLNKTIIFERIKTFFGDNININYQTITPEYKNDLKYLPTINKINTIIENKLKIKGKITYQEPYHYSCMLDEIFTQKEYNNTKYDCIFIAGGGLGWLYTPENFKVMTKLLMNDKTKAAIIGNLWYAPTLEYPEYEHKFKFMNPITSCLNNDSIKFYKKKDINDCVRNYSKILLNNKYLEMYDMLFRNNTT